MIAAFLMTASQSDWGVRDVPLAWLVSLGLLLIFAILLARFGLSYRGAQSWLIKMNLVMFVALTGPVFLVAVAAMKIDWTGIPVPLLTMGGWALIVLAAHFGWQTMLVLLLPGLATIPAKSVSTWAKVTNVCISLNSCALQGLYIYLENRPAPRL